MRVETSTDGRAWYEDMEYDYYAHGALKREVLGNSKVQGTDYAYTIQGWLKGVNSGILNPGIDVGKDGNGIATTHGFFARDAFGYNLGYYAYMKSTQLHNDYHPLKANGFEPNMVDDYLDSALVTSLYNGNISRQTTSLLKTDQSGADVMAHSYRYDYVGRLARAHIYLPTVVGIHTNDWSGQKVTSKYKEFYHYDKNGNIKKLNREGDAGAMDELTYDYTSGTNKLNRVDDAVSSGTYTVDIDDQSGTNYNYDADGNLKSDVAAGITKIEWNAYGKVKQVTKSNGDKLYFSYGATGQRIMKASEPAGGYKTRTYYISDAAGNVLATYSTIKTGENTKLTLNEQHIYGSKRIGILKREVELANNSSTLYYYPSDSSVTDISYTNPDSLPATVTYTGELPQPYGDRLYELANHLGNVQAVISDIKIPVGADTTLNHYKPDVVTMNDYYSFGMPMPGRNLNINGFRYGFNGKNMDGEASSTGDAYDFGERLYDAKLARFRSRDQLSAAYPYYSPYLFAGNNPILFIDVDGLRPGMNTAFLLPEPVLTGKRDANMVDIMSSGAMYTAPVAGTFNMFRKLQAQYTGATTYRRMVYKVGTFQDVYSGGNMESVIAEYEDAKTAGEPGKTFEDGLNAVSVPGGQAAGLLAKLPVATGTMLREIIVTAKRWRENLRLGKSFEQEYAQHLVDEGWKVTRNVSVKAWDEAKGRYRRAVIDFVATKDGVTRLIETKLRYSTPYSSAQKFVYEMMGQGKAFFVGKKAKDANLKVKDVFKGTVIERVDKYPRPINL